MEIMITTLGKVRIAIRARNLRKAFKRWERCSPVLAMRAANSARYGALVSACYRAQDLAGMSAGGMLHAEPQTVGTLPDIIF